MRRLLVLLLFGLVIAGGVAVAWQARGQAGLVEGDLARARALLARAGSFKASKLERRLSLIDRAEAHTTAAQGRLDRWPLRQLGILPLVGRDVRVARAVADSATGTVRATREVVTALQPIQTRPPTLASIQRAADALLGLHDTLERDLERVRATRALVAAAGKHRYLQAANAASDTAERAGRGLELAAGLYGPAGTARWFLAFQNPAELRGTGGLIGEYGILESSPSGPKLTTVAPYQVLDEQTDEGVKVPRQVASRYSRFAVERAWSAVNIPPDMPTVGRIITELYERTTGDRLEGVIAADPLAVAEILKVGGPIRASGVRLTAGNVAEETLVQAYVRYVKDNPARKRFLEEVARGTFASFHRAIEKDPVGLMQGLTSAARGRHVQLYSRDSAGQAALIGLGVAGSAAAPDEGDYLMPVGINAGGNKLDAFMERSLEWRVQLAADGSAKATATLSLQNVAPQTGLPRYIVGPYDRRFRKGVNELIQTLYVAGGYGFSEASLDGRRVGAEAQAELGGLALTQAVGVPSGSVAILGYQLARSDAATRVGEDRLRYRLLLRPQATVRPDTAKVEVAAPNGWRFDVLPARAKVANTTASWSGRLDQERELVFELTKA